jgi:hypothetical protein
MRPNGSSTGQAAKVRKRSTSFPNTRGNNHSRMAGRRVRQRSHRTVCTRPQPHGGVYRDVRASAWGLGPPSRTANSAIRIGRDAREVGHSVKANFFSGMVFRHAALPLKSQCRVRQSKGIVLGHRFPAAPGTYCRKAVARVALLRRTTSAPSINCRPDFLWNAGVRPTVRPSCAYSPPRPSRQ